MSNSFIFPKPRDWTTFEDIVADVFSRKYRNYNLQRYGRNGQRQHGVDIVGPTEDTGLLGIQCKHRPKEVINKNEIEEEINESEDFRPELGQYIIATSAERDTKTHKHILSLSEERKADGKYPVSIKFWDDILNWLSDYPDLVYKHFSKYFPLQELEHLSLPEAGARDKPTILWPTTASELRALALEHIGAVNKVDPYRIVLGVTTFEDVTFQGVADVEMQFASSFASEEELEGNFLSAAKELNDFKAVFNDTFFSKDLSIHLQSRLTLAFLLGWVFHKVTHFELTLIFENHVWSTGGLPHVRSHLSDELPKLLNRDSKEVVLILNISRAISSSVIDFVESWDPMPMAILGLSLETRRVTSAAHALSIAHEVAWKIKTITDKWNSRHIHLFGAMPAALATLISYHLNAICPITIYYMDSSRTQYKQGGTLTNSM